jgi:hypothetical protein
MLEVQAAHAFVRVGVTTTHDWCDLVLVLVFVLVLVLVLVAYLDGNGNLHLAPR